MIIAFGRVILFSLWFFVFALAERENEKQKMGKYRAAAGKAVFENATA